MLDHHFLQEGTVMRKSSNANRVTEASDSARQQLQRVLEAAKWPEQLEEWDLAKLEASRDQILSHPFSAGMDPPEQPLPQPSPDETGFGAQPGEPQQPMPNAMQDEAGFGAQPQRDEGEQPMPSTMQDEAGFPPPPVSHPASDEPERPAMTWSGPGRGKVPPRSLGSDWDQPEQIRNAAQADEAGRGVFPSYPERDEPEQARRMELDRRAARLQAHWSEQEQARARASREEEALGPSRPHYTEENETGSRFAKTAGWIVAGLLIIGCGVVAYQTLSTTTPAPQAAPKPLAPDETMAAQPPKPPVPPAPQNIPNRAAPDNAAPASRAMAAPNVAVPPPDIAAPPPEAPTAPSQALAASPPQAVSPVPSRSAQPPAGLRYNSAGAAMSMRSLPPDDPLNAPMTLTPETAPPPQGSSPAGGVVMQPLPADDAPIASPGTRATDSIDAPMTLTPETAPPPQLPGQTARQQSLPARQPARQ
jgi:hypothetical protein